MTLRDTLLIVLTAVIWGFNFVVIKWGVEDVSASVMTALRFAIVAVPLVFFFKRPSIPFVAVAGYGLLFGCGIWGLVNYSISLGTPAGQSSLLLQSSAFMSAIAGILLYSEKATVQVVSGIFVALVGFILVSKGAFETSSIMGVCLIFLAGLSWTICNMIVKQYKPDDAVGFIVWSSLFVPIPIIAYLAFYTTELTDPTNITGWQGLTSIAFQAFIVTIFGYSIWTRMITKYGLSSVAPYSLIVPISGLLFSAILYGETPTSIELVGSALVLVGLAVISGLVVKIVSRLRCAPDT